MTTIASLLAALNAGETTAAGLLDDSLARIRDTAGEGARAFLKVYEETARAEAEAADTKRKAGAPAGPLGGIPVAIKDLFDVSGETTMAGTKVLSENAVASEDAVIVQRLRQAGAVIVGRNNMTELAYSGIGINSHHDTPRNPWDRETGRIPGGSSSGAGVSVADGMVAAAIGTDTAGSVRIPAALNGVTGYKPTAARVDTAGCYPLSRHLDSIGPLAPTVDCCLRVDAVMAGAPLDPPAIDIGGLRLGVPQNVVLGDMDEEVAQAFERTTEALAAAGAGIVDFDFPELDDAVAAQGRWGTFQAAECWANHLDLARARPDDFDPLVYPRMKAGEGMTAADFVLLVQERLRLIAAGNRRTAGFDAVILPTVPLLAPAIQPLIDDFDLYLKNNLLMLRNTGLGNFLDRCGFSIPMQGADEPPMGLMVMGPTGGDRHTAGVALAVEEVVNVTTVA